MFWRSVNKCDSITCWTESAGGGDMISIQLLSGDLSYFGDVNSEKVEIAKSL